MRQRQPVTAPSLGDALCALSALTICDSCTYALAL